jgi:hypothetical protein
MIRTQQAKYSTINYGKIARMTLDIARIKALCFDVDGTLSDTDDLYAQKIVDILPRFLFHDPMQTARRIVMWVEAPGNALLGLADTIGIPARARRGYNARTYTGTLSHGDCQCAG